MKAIDSHWLLAADGTAGAYRQFVHVTNLRCGLKTSERSRPLDSFVYQKGRAKTPNVFVGSESKVRGSDLVYNVADRLT